MTEQHSHEDYIFSGSFPEVQEGISASDFDFWDETLVSEGELGDFEFPFRHEFNEEEAPLEDPFLFLFDEDDLSLP